MAKMGRPMIEIDEKQFQKLCALHCTKEEIAGFFECSDDTIDNFCKRVYDETFSVLFKRFSAGGKISLRRYQFKLAEKNPGMAIFLGKNWLGQSDKNETTATIEVEDLAPLAAMLRDEKPVPPPVDVEEEAEEADFGEVDNWDSEE